MRPSRYTGFLIGATILIILIVALAIANINDSRFNSNSEKADALIVQTEDPLIIRQLNDADLLPSDFPLVTFIDPQRGAANPLVDLVEFSDFACPFCQEIQTTLERLLKTYPTTLRHVWKDAPNVNLHPPAMAAHLAARCAQRQNKFWEYHDELFKDTNNLGLEQLKNIAKLIGLNQSQWQTCFDDATERAKIERGLIEAEVLGVDATPYLFINNQRISGAVTFTELQQMIINEMNATTTPTN